MLPPMIIRRRIDPFRLRLGPEMWNYGLIPWGGQRKSGNHQISIGGEYWIDRVNGGYEYIILGQAGTIQRIRDF